MPLVRLQVRNEYRLGDARLYEEPSKKDDPKATLDGTAVAGLVGLLRQLGDLAEFATDVFHGLHEQITTVTSRRRKIFTRIQNIEFALPFIEKSVKGQTRHIHFAYVTGSEWHAHVQHEKNHLVHDLPCFMLEAYEECREPPRLYLLDKFDHKGAGACLKKYSDPSHFRREWCASELGKTENSQREKKVQKAKRKGLQIRDEEFQSALYISCRNTSRRSRFASPSSDGYSSATENASVCEPGLNSEISSRSPSFGSRVRVANLDVDNLVVHSDLDDNEVLDSVVQCYRTGLITGVPNQNSEGNELSNNHRQESVHRENVSRAYSVKWDDKTEIVKPRSPAPRGMVLGHMIEAQFQHAGTATKECNNNEALNQASTLMDTIKFQGSLPRENNYNKMGSLIDSVIVAHNKLESDVEKEVKCQMKPVVNYTSQEMQDKTTSNLLSNASYSSLSHASSMLPPGSSDHMHLRRGFAGSCQNQEYPDNVMGDGNGSNTPKLEDSPLGNTSYAPSVKLWSNGGLFGVEPSKPLDPGVLHRSSTDPVPGSTTSTFSLPKYVLKSLKNESETILDENFSFSGTTSGVSSSSKCNDGIYPGSSSLVQRDSNVTLFPARAYNPVQLNGSSNPLSFCNGNQQRDIEFKQKSNDSKPLPSGAFDMNQVNDPIDTEQSFIETVTATTTGTGNGTSLARYRSFGGNTKYISSGSSEFAQRLLAHSLQQKLTIIKPGSHSPTDDKKKSEEISCLNRHKEACETLIKTSNSSYSKLASPPITEMNASFQHTNGSGNSKVKLKVLENSRNENNEDFIIPSFQMLRGSVNPSPDIVSEFDDDTFSRSCSYASENIVSPHTNSNSELWANDDKSECEDHEFCDDYPKNPLSNISFSSCMNFQPINHFNMDTANELRNYVGNSHVNDPYVPAFDLPDPDSSTSLRNRQGRHDSWTFNLPSFELQTIGMPPPPPLPPMKWRLSPTALVGDDEIARIVHETKHLKGPQVSKISFPCQQDQDASRPCLSEPKQVQVKFGVQKDPRHGISTKELNLREELLREIKNKSYKLRRTMLSRSNFHQQDVATNQC
ncbi:SCAR-like protein 2 [Curcuma longa]|uniref:SCAR-like protein 2 n=1 Tax=Curcuma longa TaxID=136217 RepID=UPI003D9F1763